MNQKISIARLLYLISIVITIIFGVFTIVGAFTTKVSPVESSFMSFLGMTLPFLIITNIILLIYWAIRFRYWVWIPLISILCNFAFITSMYQSPFKKTILPQSEQTLKISTFNTGRFGKDASNVRKVTFYMGEQQVDILCFQEFTSFNEFPIDSMNTTLLSAWPYHVIPQSEEQPILPLAIYSRYPILDSKLITYPNTPNCSMWCDISIDGKIIRVFNNHLQTTNANQVRRQYEKYYKSSNSLDVDIQFASGASNLFHVNEIMRAIQADTMNKIIKESPYPVLVCGDFNSIPSSYVYRTMKGDLKDGFKTSGKGYQSTYRYFKGIMRIDYIFHSPSLRGINYYYLKEDLGSDHNPVIMEIEYKNI